jgi:N-acetylmuramic acid 6-phosphate etherase
VATVTGCTLDEAQEYLDASGGNCKAAILIHLTGLPRPKAEQLLAENHGFLRKALEAFRNGKGKE